MTCDAVVVVYDEGVDHIIDSVRPLEVDGEVTNLSAADIVRENDAYNGYGGEHSGTMSRGDAVGVAMLQNGINVPMVPIQILLGNIQFHFV